MFCDRNNLDTKLSKPLLRESNFEQFFINDSDIIFIYRLYQNQYVQDHQKILMSLLGKNLFEQFLMKQSPKTGNRYRVIA